MAGNFNVLEKVQNNIVEMLKPSLRELQIQLKEAIPSHDAYVSNVHAQNEAAGPFEGKEGRRQEGGVNSAVGLWAT